jgi:hypothetical protein
MASRSGQPIETWVQDFMATGKLASLSKGTDFGGGRRTKYAPLKYKGD